ncbi:MAG: hypothetical protein HFACDABA_01630 [Anaerolineales bacterium]|nr:hypothetical protein [Anaerolineales bacterium]
MADVTGMLAKRARETGTRLDILEKDYALSYLLAAMTASPELGNRLVLKGGTALRKFYYPDYRFSEDLDFSTRPPGTIPEIESKMNAAIQGMNERLDERGPFHAQVEPLLLREPHPLDQSAFLVRVQFPAHRQALCRLKVEITIDEPILLPPATHPLIHDYEETLTVNASIYALEEIVAEKLRALLQSRSRLKSRGWGASRVCRDYYDLWSILRRETMIDSIPELVRRKCEIRNLNFNDPSEFLAAPLREIARTEWKAQILPFVPDSPAPETILSELENLIGWLWN